MKYKIKNIICLFLIFILLCLSTTYVSAEKTVEDVIGEENPSTISGNNFASQLATENQYADSKNKLCITDVNDRTNSNIEANKKVQTFSLDIWYGTKEAYADNAVWGLNFKLDYDKENIEFLGYTIKNDYIFYENSDGTGEFQTPEEGYDKDEFRFEATDNYIQSNKYGDYGNRRGRIMTCNFKLKDTAVANETYTIGIKDIEALTFYNNDITDINVVNAEVKVVSEVTSCNIFWNDMSFTYVQRVWNPTSHRYNENAGWTPTNADSNKISIQNTGNQPFNVRFLYEKLDETVSVSIFDENNKYVADGLVNIAANDIQKHNFIASLWSDNQPSSEMQNFNLGKMTIRLEGVE